MSETPLTSVQAKFNCTRKSSHDFGWENNQSEFEFSAVYAGSNASEEDRQFTDATPSGNIKISIDHSKPAADFFKPGKKYYVTFTEAAE